MNSFLKFGIVAIIFFLLGVIVTILNYPDMEKADQLAESSEFRTNQSSKATQERKPFFVKIKENTNIFTQHLKDSASEFVQTKGTIQIKSQIDFIKLNEAVDNFNNEASAELRKRFYSGYDEKDPIITRNIQHLKGRLELMFMEKETHYRASFSDETSNSKINLFFQFTPCNDAKPKPAMKFKDICYSLDMFSLQNNMWWETNISSSVSGLFWYKDSAYTYINLSGLGDFSKLLNSPMAVVPIPDDLLPIHYLKYENNKFSWAESSEVKWSVAGEKDLDKFIDWKNDYNKKHRQAPQQ